MITILAERLTPRLSYVFDFVFKEVFGQAFEIRTIEVPSIEIHLSYGDHLSGASHGIQVPSCGLLFSTDIDQGFDEIIRHEIEKYSAWSKDSSSPFADVFSIVFYCLTRYEEYHPGPRDEHHRFSSEASIMSQTKWIERPIVDEILLSIKELFIEKCHYPISKQKRYDFISTLDIDQVWAYKEKGFSGLLGMGRDFILGEWKRLSTRVRTWIRSDSDPFDTFDLIKDLHTKYGLSPIFFVLAAAKTSTHDRNHSLDNHRFSELLTSYFANFEVGIHPSYSSNASIEVLSNEIASLSLNIDRPITKSRQHFLKMQLPTTYHNLVRAGIEQDYTMGYADRVGYRGGTGHDFLWYDLSIEQVSTLRIQPFQVMDGTLNFYQNLPPADALTKVIGMIEVAKKLDTPFSILWHNSSFDANFGWDGWGEIYESILQNAKHD